MATYVVRFFNRDGSTPVHHTFVVNARDDDAAWREALDQFEYETGKPAPEMEAQVCLQYAR